MDVNKILNADVLDIIFEGKNKDYGAYELRKSYKKRVLKSIYIMIGIVILFFILYALSGITKKEKAVVFVQDVSLENLQEQRKEPPPPPPPPPPKPLPPKVEIAKFTPPKIVKDQDVKPQDQPPDLDKLENTKIGSFNQSGLKDNGLVAPAERSIGGVAAPKSSNEDYDKVFTVVQIPATYPGGLDAWKRFLQRNLNQNVPVDNGAPSGTYSVTLTFIVDKQGNISDIQAETDPGYGTKEEAIRVLRKGGGWKPAVQNGRPVIYRNRQTITFVVNEE